ncbi:MAG TPA: hypothetical protein VF008_14975 [Niastella sp.]
MRKAFFILFFFCSTRDMAQSRVFAEFLGWNERQVQLQTISNRTGQSSCTFVMSNDSIRAFVFTGQLKLMGQFSLPHRSGTRLLGGFMRDSSLYMFSEQPQGELLCLSLNVVTEEIKENLFRPDPQREIKVTSISAGNHFIFITAAYRSKEITIYDFENEEPATLIRCRFSNSLWRDLTGGYGRAIRLQNMDPDAEMDPDALVKKNKLYLNNGSVLLVMNNHIDSTHLVNFDLQQQKVKSWVIDHNPEKEKFKLGDYSDNSFFFRNKLYYVRATSDRLMVQVVDAVNGVINKTYTTENGDEIDYKNTPIIQEETANNRIKDPKDLNRTSKLLRRMTAGSAVIAAKQHGNDLVEVVVGSYEKTVRTTFVGGYNGFNQVGPYGYSGAMMFPTRPLSRRVFRDTYTQSSYFKTLLNAENYSHMPGEPVSSAYERIERYAATLKTEPGAENIFELNGQYYYIYYDKAERRLVVLKF